MKIELIYVEDKYVGYTIVSENDAESLALNEVNENYIAGTGNKKLVYESGKENIPGKTDEITFVQKKFLDDGSNSSISVKERKGKRIDMFLPYLYKCPKCGSTDVELTAWVKPNEGYQFSAIRNEGIGNCEGFCPDCNEGVELIKEHNTDDDGQRA